MLLKENRSIEIRKNGKNSTEFIERVTVRFGFPLDKYFRSSFSRLANSESVSNRNREKEMNLIEVFDRSVMKNLRHSLLLTLLAEFYSISSHSNEYRSCSTNVSNVRPNTIDPKRIKMRFVLLSLIMIDRIDLPERPC